MRLALNPMRDAGSMLLCADVTQHVAKAVAAFAHAVVAQRRRAAKAHVAACINDAEGGLMAAHEVSLVAWHPEDRDQLLVELLLQCQLGGGLQCYGHSTSPYSGRFAV